MTQPPNRRQVSRFLAAAVGGVVGGRRVGIAGPFTGEFNPPSPTDYDLLYYLPGNLGPLHSELVAPARGPAPRISGSEFMNVEERSNMLLGSENWAGGTAYVFFEFELIPAEITCYFRSPAGVLSFPTVGIASDFTGTIPFWHLQINANISGFIPEFSYNKPPLVSTGMQWITQKRFDPGKVNGWLIYRAQQSQYEARLSLETLDGTLLAECYCLSANLRRHLGGVVFFELLGGADDSYAFGFLGAKSSIRKERQSWMPTGVLVADSMAQLPSPGTWRARSIGSDPLVSTVTYVPARQVLEIQTEAAWSGGAIDIGSVNDGDLIDIWGSCESLDSQGSAMGAVIAFISDGRSSSNDYVYVRGIGPFHHTFKIYKYHERTSILIGLGNSNGYVKISIRDILITRNKVTLEMSASNP